MTVSTEHKQNCEKAPNSAKGPLRSHLFWLALPFLAACQAPMAPEPASVEWPREYQLSTLALASEAESGRILEAVIESAIPPDHRHLVVPMRVNDMSLYGMNYWGVEPAQSSSTFDILGWPNKSTSFDLPGTGNWLAVGGERRMYLISRVVSNHESFFVLINMTYKHGDVMDVSNDLYRLNDLEGTPRVVQRVAVRVADRNLIPIAQYPQTDG